MVPAAKVRMNVPTTDRDGKPVKKGSVIVIPTKDAVLLQPQCVILESEAAEVQVKRGLSGTTETFLDKPHFDDNNPSTTKTVRIGSSDIVIKLRKRRTRKPKPSSAPAEDDNTSQTSTEQKPQDQSQSREISPPAIQEPHQ